MDTVAYVGQLRLEWSCDLQSRRGVEATRSVAVGVTDVSASSSIVHVLAARTGPALWVHDPDPPDIGVGNGFPSSRHIRSPTGGDKLFLASVVALNPNTGEYHCHDQCRSGDTRDYTQHIIPADLEIGGETPQMMMRAPDPAPFWGGFNFARTSGGVDTGQGRALPRAAYAVGHVKAKEDPMRFLPMPVLLISATAVFAALAAPVAACPDLARAGQSDRISGGQTRSYALQAGGPHNLTACPQPGTGWTAAAAHLGLSLAGGGGGDLTFRVQAGCDTVLLVNDARGQWLFNDDSQGLNPAITVPAAPLTGSMTSGSARSAAPIAMRR